MMYNVFFICFDETDKEKNWQRVLHFHPNAIKIDSIHGISEAHMKCNELSTTDRFWTVDGDNWLLQPLHDDTKLDIDLLQFNTIDGVDGNVSSVGGTKLWKKNSIINDNMSKGDFCKHATKTSLVIQKTLSIHKYNASPYESWRHTFRHMVKCFSGIINEEGLRINLEKVETHKHLNTHSYRGYLDAKAYVEECAGDFNKINLINDYAWLKLKCPKEMQSPL